MNALSALLHLIYPHICAGCGEPLFNQDQGLCLHCITNLPATQFENLPHNPVEKMFTGRVQIEQAAAIYYFNKDSILQNILHAIKYKGNTVAAKHLGILAGIRLENAPRFDKIDALIPLPLHKKKQAKRGYNQSEVMGNALAAQCQLPVINDAAIRYKYTETQTRKSREERNENVKNIFEVVKPEKLANKHLLIMDDIITTGSSLESFALCLHQVPGVKISVIAVAMANF